MKPRYDQIHRQNTPDPNDLGKFVKEGIIFLIIVFIFSLLMAI